MKLRFTPQALIEIDDILAHIARHSPQGAGRVQARIKTITDLLEKYPESGQLTSFRGMRRITATPYPYFVYYLIADDELVIVGIRHTARDPATMPDAT